MVFPTQWCWRYHSLPLIQRYVLSDYTIWRYNKFAWKLRHDAEQIFIIVYAWYSIHMYEEVLNCSSHVIVMIYIRINLQISLYISWWSHIPECSPSLYPADAKLCNGIRGKTYNLNGKHAIENAVLFWHALVIFYPILYYIPNIIYAIRVFTVLSYFGALPFYSRVPL